MGLGEYFRINATGSDVFLDIYRGHYATSHSHTNYYIDISKTTASINEAKAVAKALALKYQSTTVVDTILCMDGTEVIGAMLARELTKEGYSINAGNDICVLRPEYTQGSQIFFRDNTRTMIDGKRVLILSASVVTGFTAKSAIEAIHYFGGKPVGIASIYANITASYGIPVESIFNTGDLPGYTSSTSTNDCPMCRRGEKINGLVNMYGISAL